MRDPDLRLTPPLSAARRAAIPAWVGADVRATLDAPDESPVAALLLAARVLRAAAGEPEDRAELSRWVGESARGAVLRAVVERALDASSEALGAVTQLCASSPEALETLEVELGRPIEPNGPLGPVTTMPEDSSGQPGAGAAPFPRVPSSQLGTRPGGRQSGDEPLAEAAASLALRVARARDEVESAAWALGLSARHGSDRTEAALGERRVLEAAARVDEIGQALRTEIGRAAREVPDDPWLSSVARLDDGWWLDAWSTPPMSEADLRGLSSPAASNVLVLRPPRLRMEQPMAVAASDAVSAKDRALEADPGPVLARLLDGRVLVHAVGWDDDRLPVGLVVQPGPGATFADLVSVRLEPPGSSPTERDVIAQAWWVPLSASGSARRTLQVELADGACAHLDIEPE